MATKTQQPLAGLFRLCLLGEKKGLMGAPTFHISLLVDPSRNTTSGVVHITQSVTPPGGDITVDVTGTYHELVFGADVTRSIVLQGTYAVACPPPALCIMQEKFTASIVLDNKWNGTGNFHWGNMADLDVPVSSVDC